MIEFLQLGGFPMYFVLLFGVATLAASIGFARRPAERGVGTIRAMSVATVFAVLSGLSAAFVTVCLQVPARPEWAHSPDLVLIVMTGVGESLTLAIVGFSFLAVAWLVTALGVRRMGDLG